MHTSTYEHPINPGLAGPQLVRTNDHDIGVVLPILQHDLLAPADQEQLRPQILREVVVLRLRLINVIHKRDTVEHPRKFVEEGSRLPVIITKPVIDVCFLEGHLPCTPYRFHPTTR